ILYGPDAVRSSAISAATLVLRGLLQRPDAGAISAFATLPVPASPDAQRRELGLTQGRQIDLFGQEVRLNI
ncbi:MAG: hypothetical protein ACREDP_08250, partial [Bradyrhizobium sp.]